MSKTTDADADTLGRTLRLTEAGLELPATVDTTRKFVVRHPTRELTYEMNGMRVARFFAPRHWDDADLRDPKNPELINPPRVAIRQDGEETVYDVWIDVEGEDE